MKILSLFDGMACGMLAMKASGVNVDRYVAYEIDKYAVKTATHNFPQIEEKGNVFTADFTQYQNFDFLVGGSPCFTKGHMILTSHGYKDISEVIVGDKVLTHTGEYHKVIRVNEREADTQEVKAIGYAPMITTPEHPFLTLERHKATYAEYKETKSWRVFSDSTLWTPAECLSKNHFVGMRIPTAMDSEDNDMLDLETMYILGQYVADGHVQKEKRTGQKNSYQCQLVLSIGKGKEDVFKSHIINRHFSFFSHTESCSRAVFNSSELVDFVLDNRFGQGAVNKIIPEFIFQLPLSKQKAFLSGYLDGDGCFIKASNSWSVSTVSKKLALGIQRLIASIYGTNAGITISNNNRLHEIDGREIKSNYPLYTIVFKTNRRALDKSYIRDNIMWTQVKSSKPTGRKEIVYNIEVEGDHSYTVDNCIVHNCTYWSIAQNSHRETTASGLGWELFSQYVRALKEAKPKYFIYENNKSMSNAIRDSIRETFGFNEICVNSALVSAQNRQRYYWVGKYNAETDWYDKVLVNQPEDKGILLKDILDGIYSGAKELSEKEMEYMIRSTKDGRNHFDYGYIQDGNKDKGSCLTANVSKGVPYNVCCEPIRVGCMPSPDGTIKGSQANRVYEINGKSVNQVANGGGAGAKTGLYAVPVPNYIDPCCVAERGRYNKENKIEQHYEARNDGKTSTLTTVQKDNMVAEPVEKQLLCVVDSEKMRVPEATRKGYIDVECGNCVDMTEPNSKTRRGRDMSRKSNCLTTSPQYYQYIGTMKWATPVEWDNEGNPIKAISGSDGKIYTVYRIKDKKITINGNSYPIKLVDGYYIIRKLTVNECKRLQTVPDWYEFPVSNTQAYKQLGNGWTCDVISHLINSCLNNRLDK